MFVGKNRVKSRNLFRWAPKIGVGGWGRGCLPKEKKNFSLAFHVRVMHNKRKNSERMSARSQEPGGGSATPLHICVREGEGMGTRGLHESAFKY